MKIWIEAFRLRTLPLALSSTIFGTASAFHQGFFDISIFTFAVLTTILLQILSNLANDYGDFKKGTDNEDRLGPDRSLQSGKISISQMKKAIYLFVVLSLISGITLLYLSFGLQEIYKPLSFLGLGLFAIWAAINYTSGHASYGYKALGDVFVFIFFGIVGVYGTFYLYAQNFENSVILPSITSGLFAVAVLNLNNMRDIENDAASGKTTIPVLIGLKAAKIYQYVIFEIGFWSLMLYNYLWDLSEGYLAAFILVPLLWIGQSLKNSEGKEIDPLLKKMALTTFVTSILFFIGVALSSQP